MKPVGLLLGGQIEETIAILCYTEHKEHVYGNRAGRKGGIELVQYQSGQDNGATQI